MNRQPADLRRDGRAPGAVALTVPQQIARDALQGRPARLFVALAVAVVADTLDAPASFQLARLALYFAFFARRRFAFGSRLFVTKRAQRTDWPHGVEQYFCRPSAGKNRRPHFGDPQALNEPACAAKACTTMHAKASSRLPP